MKKKKRNWNSIDYLDYDKKYEAASTIVFLFLTVVSMISGLILLKTDFGYSIGLFIGSGVFGILTLASFFAYSRSKKLLKKILDSLSDEEKNDVSFLMSIDCRDYLKKNKEEEDDEDLE